MPERAKKENVTASAEKSIASLKVRDTFDWMRSPVRTALITKPTTLKDTRERMRYIPIDTRVIRDARCSQHTYTHTHTHIMLS